MGSKKKGNGQRLRYKRGGKVGVFLAVLLCGISLCSIQARATEEEPYFGKNEDYLLRTKKPDERGAGHYFEFVNGEEESYTVQAGDTLWGIADKFYGSGTAYQQLWEDNKERVHTPETLQTGTKLKLQERLYTAAGIQDYVRDDVIDRSRNTDAAAWEWEPEGNRYQIFQTLTYRNDFGQKAPCQYWEEFKREVTNCARTVCGERVSELSFSRYRVTGLCDMGYYQFVFDGGSKQYLVMAAFSYTGEEKSEEFVVLNGYGEAMSLGCENMKSEIFTVCDLDRCDEADLKEARGKTFYLAARCIDSLMYFPKMADYVGADDWNYPQLHNPFTQAMHSFCKEPLERAAVSSKNQRIVWKDAVLEELVRKELARLWQLTDEEKKAFMERPVTTADFAGIERLSLYEDWDDQEIYLALNTWEASGNAVLYDEGECAKSSQKVLTTLDDLGNFTDLKRLDITLRGADITDFSAVGRLTGLRELYLELGNMRARIENQDIAFLGNLKDLRLLYLYGRDYKAGSYLSTPTRSLEKITDLSVLTNCPKLAYLKLAAGNVENYHFITELPQIYYMELMGAPDMKNTAPNPSLMPNACFIEYYDEQILFDIGRG